MNLDKYWVWLAMAPAPTPGTPRNEKAEMAKLIGMMLIMGFVMYFIMIRPQRQRQKQLQNLLTNIKPGDKVVTSAGIVGIIITVKDKTISLRSGDTKMEVLKSAVTEITEKAGESASSEPSKN
jgi:preprotein translocase subunit YajC